MDHEAAKEWIRGQVAPAGPFQLVHERPWSTVLRVPLAAGVAWFKACGPVQAFEPRLTAQLFSRWPDRVPRVLALDEPRAWLLLADAGSRIADHGNLPKYWMAILPRYAELQRGEAAHTADHLAHGVPDLRVATLAACYDDLLRHDLPLTSHDREQLTRFAPRFDHLCTELAAHHIPDTIQHDDLHMNNVFLQRSALRVLDWGDSSISHPFASLVPTFRFLEERNQLSADDPSFARLRDAYLEPWGRGMIEVFSLALRVGAFAHAIAGLRQRAAVSGVARQRFDHDLAVRLQRALAGVRG